jgi:hypothetical protein
MASKLADHALLKLPKNYTFSEKNKKLLAELGK